MIPVPLRVPLQLRLLTSHEQLVEPIVNHRIGQRQVAELAMAVGSFRRREDALGHRASDAMTEAFKEVNGGRALSVTTRARLGQRIC